MEMKDYGMILSALAVLVFSIVLIFVNQGRFTIHGGNDMSETILVTGASAGFGQRICRRLVADGYRVIGSARRIDKLQAPSRRVGRSLLSPANGCDGIFLR